jgi:glyoxylase-like metal-dependent hydrolase (beta-lactamase superfamily II)
MEQDGISMDPVELVISTHCHPDHLEAVPSIVNGNPKATMHKKEYEYLQDEGAALYQMMGIPIPSIPVEFFLQEGTLQVGPHQYQIIHTPGHSPGAISIYWPQRKALVTGDLLFAAGVGRTDFPGGDAQQLIESIERVRKLDVQIILPGHGEIILGEDRVKENFQIIEANYYAFL